jgi:hypothetical protein
MRGVSERWPERGRDEWSWPILCMDDRRARRCHRSHALPHQPDRYTRIIADLAWTLSMSQAQLETAQATLEHAQLVLARARATLEAGRSSPACEGEVGVTRVGEQERERAKP